MQSRTLEHFFVFFFLIKGWEGNNKGLYFEPVSIRQLSCLESGANGVKAKGLIPTWPISIVLLPDLTLCILQNAPLTKGSQVIKWWWISKIQKISVGYSQATSLSHCGTIMFQLNWSLLVLKSYSVIFSLYVFFSLILCIIHILGN